MVGFIMNQSFPAVSISCCSRWFLHRQSNPCFNVIELRCSWSSVVVLWLSSFFRHGDGFPVMCPDCDNSCLLIASRESPAFSSTQLFGVIHKGCPHKKTEKIDHLPLIRFCPHWAIPPPLHADVQHGWSLCSLFSPWDLQNLLYSFHFTSTDLLSSAFFIPGSNSSQPFIAAGQTSAFHGPTCFTVT